MSTTPTPAQQLPTAETSCPRKLIQELAHFADGQNEAMSFYFDSTGTANCSHQDEYLRLQSIVSLAHSALGDDEHRQERVEDLSILNLLEPELHSHPRMFRALFAFHKSGFCKHIVLPFATNLELLHFGRQFELVPLMRALEACSPYAVLLVENGRARGFDVRGDEITESTALSSTADIKLRPENEPEGWPHHVDANALERSHRFLRELAESMSAYLAASGAKHLIVGCREGLWGSFEPELARFKIDHVDTFHQKNFDVSASEVLDKAKVVFRQMKQREYGSFWKTLAEAPKRSVFGVDKVLHGLEEGRVHRLFLGTIPDTQSFECAQCGKSQPGAVRYCRFCRSTELYSMPTDELLLRKALATGADVIAPPNGHLNPKFSVGAMLRY